MFETEHLSFSIFSLLEGEKKRIKGKKIKIKIK